MNIRIQTQKLFGCCCTVHLTDKMVVGLFGDSEQAIYKEGIGSAQVHIEAGELTLVEKEDNFRCSLQVIEFANKFRTDDLTQEIAFKTFT